jgi:hypothetical protein
VIFYTVNCNLITCFSCESSTKSFSFTLSLFIYKKERKEKEKRREEREERREKRKIEKRKREREERGEEWYID